MHLFDPALAATSDPNLQIAGETIAVDIDDQSLAWHAGLVEEK